jgi:hypothetical protein
MTGIVRCKERATGAASGLSIFELPVGLVKSAEVTEPRKRKNSTLICDPFRCL